VRSQIIEARVVQQQFVVNAACVLDTSRVARQHVGVGLPPSFGGKLGLTLEGLKSPKCDEAALGGTRAEPTHVVFTPILWTAPTRPAATSVREGTLLTHIERTMRRRELVRPKQAIYDVEGGDRDAVPEPF